MAALLLVVTSGPALPETAGTVGHPQAASVPVADTVLLTGEVTAEGALRARVERRLRGSGVEEERALRTRPSREALAELVRATAASMGLAGSMRDVEADLLRGEGDALGVTFRTTIPDWITVGEGEVEGRMPLPVPLLLRSPEGDGGALEERGLRHYARGEIAFPPGTEMVPPIPGEGASDVGSFRSSPSVVGRTLRLEQEVVLQPDGRSVTGAAAYAAFLSDVRRSLRTAFSARRGPPRYAEVDGDDPDALARAGLAARADGRTGRAIELLRRAVELDPDHGEAWSWLGNAYLEAGRPREAESALRRQMELDPGLGHTVASLGVALDRQGRTREAEEAYRRQLEMRSGDPYASVGLASLLVEQGKVEDARPHLDATADLETDDVRLLLTLGWTLLHAGRPERAVPVLEEVVEADSSMAAARAHLGSALRRAGSSGEALPHLRAAVELAPDRPEFRVDLARELWRAERDREALEVLAEGMSRAEGDPPIDLCRAYGHTLTRLGRGDRAPSCRGGDGGS